MTRSGNQKVSAKATTHSHSVDAIIFDIGRVIVRLEPRRALMESAATAQGVDAGPRAEKMWRAVQADPMWQDWQEGRVTAAQWHENLCRNFGMQVSFEDFCRSWNNVISPDLILPERLFRELAKRVRLVLLSNTDEIHVAHMRKNFGFTRHFHAKIYSCEVGASKPSRQIFQAAVRAAGVPAAGALFIDDVQAYVLAARKYGLQAIQFRSRAQLEAELRRRKLLDR
jgi:glucose-1-phosphatase